MTTIIGGICPRCGQFHDLILAVDGSIICRNADGAAERIRRLEAERDAARAEVAALRERLDGLRAKVEGLRCTCATPECNSLVDIGAVLALLDEAQP